MGRLLPDSPHRDTYGDSRLEAASLTYLTKADIAPVQLCSILKLLY